MALFNLSALSFCTSPVSPTRGAFSLSQVIGWFCIYSTSVTELYPLSLLLGRVVLQTRYKYKKHYYASLNDVFSIAPSLQNPQPPRNM
jgi:hypothetical protein